MLSRALALLLLALPARAYKREEHSATLRLILASGSVPPKDAALVAACARLPDEAFELSAIDIYRRLMRHPLDYAVWAAMKKGPVATTGRMLTMQQLLHGITGGSSERMQDTARALVLDLRPALSSKPGPDRADALCALGFAFHLYADSFAHQMLKNPDKMYETGLGHFFDSAKPDFPLYSRARAGAWREFVMTAGELVPGSKPAALKALADEADALQSGAAPKNGWKQRELVAELDRRLGASGAGSVASLGPELRARGCQAAAASFSKALKLETPDCEKTWTIYRDAAIRRFDAAEAEPGKPPLRGSPFRRLQYFRDSPFSKGSSW